MRHCPPHLFTTNHNYHSSVAQVVVVVFVVFKLLRQYSVTNICHPQVVLVVFVVFKLLHQYSVTNSCHPQVVLVVFVVFKLLHQYSITNICHPQVVSVVVFVVFKLLLDGRYTDSSACKMNVPPSPVPPCCRRDWCVAAWTAVGRLFCLAFCFLFKQQPTTGSRKRQ